MISFNEETTSCTTSGINCDNISATIILNEQQQASPNDLSGSEKNMSEINEIPSSAYDEATVSHQIEKELQKDNILSTDMIYTAAHMGNIIEDNYHNSAGYPLPHISVLNDMLAKIGNESMAHSIDSATTNDDMDEEERAHDEEITRITKPIFENPLGLIDMDADLNEFLAAKRISDAIRIVTKNFPEMPSRKRVAYINTAVMTNEAKEDIMKRRNRENAALTRKRQRIYSDFLDKTIEQLEDVLSGAREYVTAKPGAGEEEEVVAETRSKRKIKKKTIVDPI